MSLAVLQPVAAGLILLVGSGHPRGANLAARQQLFQAHPWILWTSVLSDVLTALSYALFFAGICWLVRRLKHLSQLNGYLWVLNSFRVFVLASGASILMRVVNVWLPLYQFSIAFKIFCAAASIPTAIIFAWQLPALAANITRFVALLLSDKQHRNALRKSEAFLDRSGRIAGVGGWEVDLVHNEVTWSAETYRIHGAPLDYKPTLEAGISFYTPECRPIITAAVEAACAGGDGFDLELSITRFDGRRIWVRAVGAAEFVDGKAIRLAGAFQDISARVAERTALKEANDRVTLATDSGGIGIWDWDIQQGIVNCDAWMHRLHGITAVRGPVDALVWREQLHPDDRESVVQALNDAVSGARTYDTEFRVVWPDHSIHNIRATGQVTRDPSGRALRMVGANWDVTEARRLTAELAQQHELLRVTLQSIGDGVITTDEDGRVVWLNPVAERMTGWTTASALHRPIEEVFQIVHCETGLEAENPIVTCLSSGSGATLAPDTDLISRDGTRFGIEDSAAPILGERGQLLGAVLVFHDVTEQRRLLAETARVTRDELKLKDHFLSHVSHELRSPLTSIYSFTSIIADGLAGDTTPDQQEYLQIVLKNVNQLQSMIEDLLTVTKAREGKLSIDLQSTSVPAAVVDALHTIQSQAAAKSISLASRYASHLTPALADPTRLRQVLIVLLDNAVKFTPEGGSITVRVTEKPSGQIQVDVTDTGCGIPREARARVFENLYQVTTTDHTHANQNGRNGLGLGLHIARDLVTRQGGDIWITDAPTRGTVFSFTLPFFDHASATEPLDLAS